MALFPRRASRLPSPRREQRGSVEAVFAFVASNTSFIVHVRILGVLHLAAAASADSLLERAGVAVIRPRLDLSPAQAARLSHRVTPTREPSQVEETAPFFSIVQCCELRASCFPRFSLRFHLHIIAEGNSNPCLGLHSSLRPSTCPER